MKLLVGTFNQEKALVGAFSVIVQPVVEPMDRFTALTRSLPPVLLGAVELVLHLIAGGAAHIRLLAASENINYHRIKR